MFSGVMASHSALKEHAESLEATLAKRESSVAAMGAHVNEELGRKDNEVVDLRRQVKEVQQLLDAEKQASKELKKQVRAHTTNAVIYGRIFSQKIQMWLNLDWNKKLTLLAKYDHIWWAAVHSDHYVTNIFQGRG